MIRQCAEQKNCNPTFSNDIIIPLCLFHVVRLCLLYISFTDGRIFICLSKDGSYYVLTSSVCLSVCASIHLKVCLSINFSCPRHISLTDWRIFVNPCQNIPRRCAVFITEPCPMKVKVTIHQSSNGNVSCLLCNFKTVNDYFIKLCSNMWHH